MEIDDEAFILRDNLNSSASILQAPNTIDTVQITNPKEYVIVYSGAFPTRHVIRIS